MAFELERCGGMNTCTSPPPQTPHSLRIPFTLSHSAALSKWLKRKGERAEKRKFPKTPPRLSVWGQRSEVSMEGVCQVLSGADKPMESLFTAYRTGSLPEARWEHKALGFSRRSPKQIRDQKKLLL